MRCEVEYGTDGVESCMGWGARSCIEQMCRIVYGGGCEVVHGTDGVESCMELRCEVMYGTGGVESCIGMGCEVVY